MNFSDQLKMLRNDQMLSISQLAEKSDLSQSFVYRLESGEKQPTLESLHKLSNGLGIGLGELLGEDSPAKSESPVLDRIIGNIKQLSPEQIDALDLFLASISKERASGEKPLTLQTIHISCTEPETFEMELVFSSNVSAVMEHRILDGIKRNKSCFLLYDSSNNQIPIELIPGKESKFGRQVDRIFVMKPLIPLHEDQIYTLTVSRLLQANNYKYLKENHTIIFSTSEILSITPYNKKLCDPYLSLSLEKSLPAYNEDNISCETDIRLLFSNDISASDIRVHNQNCFSLRSSRDQLVDIDIIFAEKNDSPERKKEVIIRPCKSLEHNTVYILTVSSELMGKNQKNLGIDRVITFVTADSDRISKLKPSSESIA